MPAPPPPLAPVAFTTDGHDRSDTGKVSRDDPAEVLEPQSSVTPRALPEWLRRLALVAAVVVGVAVLALSDPLSGEPPPPKAPPPASAERSGPPGASPPAVIARNGFDVVRYGPRGATRVARTPPDFAPDARLWAVDDAGYPALLYGVSEGRLFRIDAARRDLVADVGTVERIVDVGPGAGELVVQLPGGSGSIVVVMEAATGDVIDRDPFPGFDGSDSWTPRRVMSVFGVPGLLLTRPGRDGRDEVAIAWSDVGVASGFFPSRLQRFGSTGRLLGVADDWVLFLADDCPSSTCTLTVLSFTRDGSGMRKVLAPSGWSFVEAMTGGDSHEVLVPVRKDDDDSVHALARLVPGGDSALLLQASIGLDPAAGLVAEPDGSVYFLRAEGPGKRVLARWSPVDPPHILTFPKLPPLPASARLVCLCD